MHSRHAPGQTRRALNHLYHTHHHTHHHTTTTKTKYTTTHKEQTHTQERHNNTHRADGHTGKVQLYTQSRHTQERSTHTRNLLFRVFGGLRFMLLLEALSRSLSVAHVQIHALTFIALEDLTPGSTAQKSQCVNHRSNKTQRQGRLVAHMPTHTLVSHDYHYPSHLRFSLPCPHPNFVDNSVINSWEDDKKVKLFDIPAGEQTIQRQFAEAAGTRHIRP